MAGFDDVPGTGSEGESSILTRDKVEMPKMYRVLLHNDHYTTMEFVVEVLMKVFRKDEPEAYKIMMDVHKKGIGVCGVYTYDIARTKVNEVHTRAREKDHPLRCSYEEV
jgi:ATP-dependent Clp protease adaptor protein ClpS